MFNRGDGGGVDNSLASLASKNLELAPTNTSTPSPDPPRRPLSHQGTECNYKLHHMILMIINNSI